MDELHRVLKKGGRYVLFSFHHPSEIEDVLQRTPSDMVQPRDWTPTAFLLRNPRFPEIRVACYSLVVADREPSCPGSGLPLDVERIKGLVSPSDGKRLCLTEEEAADMRRRVQEERAAAVARRMAERQAQQQSSVPGGGGAAATTSRTEPPQPPNGTLEDQLRQRRASLRRAPSPSASKGSCGGGSSNRSGHGT